MKETYGTMWIFGLVITFILLFSMFLILALNYNDAFRIKNEITSILEKYEGFTTDSKQVIDNYMQANAYFNKGTCPEGYHAVESFDEKGDTVGSGDSNSSFYCLRRNTSYYDIIVFYKFNLPVIGDIISFQITGETKEINIYEEGSNFIH